MQTDFLTFFRYFFHCLLCYLLSLHFARTSTDYFRGEKGLARERLKALAVPRGISTLTTKLMFGSNHNFNLDSNNPIAPTN